MNNSSNASATAEKTYLFSNRDLRELMIPLVMEQFLAVLVGMVSSILVANVGEAAVSGVSLIDNIIVLLIQIFAALATGGAVVAGQYLGQKNTTQARNATQQLMWFIGVISIVVMVAAYLGKPFILYRMFGHITDEVRVHANSYLVIVAASIPFIALYNGGAAIFRTMGKSKVTLKVSLLMNTVNIAFGALFVFGLNWGTKGVGVAALMARITSAVVIIALLLSTTEELHLKRTLHHRFEWNMIKKISFVGIPNGLENGMFQLGKVLLLSLISSFGTAAITANAVGNAITFLQILPGTAISLGMTPVIARCVGAGEEDQARYYNRKLLSISYLSLGIWTLLILVFLTPILRLYNLSPETMQLAKNLVRIHAYCGLAIWPIAFNLPVTLRAAGDARFTMVISIISMWAFRLFLGYVLGRHFQMGVIGVWIAMIIDWVFRTIFFVWRYRSGRWLNYSIIQQE